MFFSETDPFQKVRLKVGNIIRLLKKFQNYSFRKHKEKINNHCNF